MPEVLAAGGGTFSDTLHIILGMVSVLLMFAAVGFGAASFSRRFRIYSILTMVVTLVFGALTGMDGPRIGANLPTPWVGVWLGIFMYIGTRLFAPGEEKELARTFAARWTEYCAKIKIPWL